tara:strand:- start:21 stop:206 length:186 start_codon:yes stop_codon:yes gene_type:complete
MPQGKGTYGSKVGRPPAKKKPVAKRARSMPLSEKQAKAAVQALRDEAGRKQYRTKKSMLKK